MASTCAHFEKLGEVVPRSIGCVPCEESGQAWTHLRICTSCGYVGCCETSPGRHALAHHEETGHPLIRPFDEPGSWAWCYVDQTYIGTPILTRDW